MQNYRKRKEREERVKEYDDHLDKIQNQIDYLKNCDTQSNYISHFFKCINSLFVIITFKRGYSYNRKVNK